MPSILDHITALDTRRFAAGQVIIEQNSQTGLMFFLVEGWVEVLKDGVQVASVTQPGAVFGELSALLNVNHTATVRAVEDSTLRVIDRPREFLESSPVVCVHVCELLARRLDGLTKYLVDVQQQFAGEDHIAMVGGVIDALMNRPPAKRVRPRESTIRRGETVD